MEISEKGATISKKEDTFFNPAQKLNRDSTIAVINEVYKDKPLVKIFGAMSATGLREIRSLQEVQNSQLFINDISPAAIETIKENLVKNGFNEFKVYNPEESIRVSESRINITNSDCVSLMSSYKSFFDVIDIDPFGSCVPFIESALHAVKNYGLLALTCTDKASLCSKEDRCYARYGVNIKRLFSKNETPVRVLLSHVSRVAAKLDFSIEPLFTLSVDFYLRIIVRVKKRGGKRVITDNSFFYICECFNILKQDAKKGVDSRCKTCGSFMRSYGPFWSEKLYNKDLIHNLLSSESLKEDKRFTTILSLISQELDIPFYYEMPHLCSLYKTNGCKVRDLMNGLANRGWNVSLVYCDNNSIKTDAPIDEIRKVLTARSTPGNPENIDFTPHTKVTEIYDTKVSKGIIMSSMKPGSLPKRSME